ncbi:MAG: hypothetical protein ACRDPW_07870 [Mycobacteriales bacterium]
MTAKEAFSGGKEPKGMVVFELDFFKRVSLGCASEGSKPNGALWGYRLSRHVRRPKSTAAA